MGSSLVKSFSKVDLTNVASAAFKYSKKYGAAIGQITYKNRHTVIQAVTPHVKVVIHIMLPVAASKAQRKAAANDLRKLGFTQTVTAAATGFSQATISRSCKK